MRENVLISFKHEYIRLTLSSWCDVTSDVISMKILFLGLFTYDRSISDVKLKLPLKIVKNLEIFKIEEILRSWQTFSSVVSPEIRYAILIAMCITFILPF